MNQGNSGAEDKSHGAAWTEESIHSYVRDPGRARSPLLASWNKKDAEFGCILTFKLLVHSEETGLSLLHKVLCCC